MFFYEEDIFKINGEEFKIISPESPAELAEGLRLEKILVDAQLKAEDQEIKQHLELLTFQQQKENAAFIESLGDFNDLILIKNLKYFLDTSGLRIAKLEEMLQISKGYLSRIANGKSNKRMSVDVLWKISKLFGISMQAMVTNDFSAMTESEQYIVKFIEKISNEARSGSLLWQTGSVDCIYEYCAETDHYNYPHIVQSDKFDYVDSAEKIFSTHLDEGLSVCVVNVKYKRVEDGSMINGYEIWVGDFEEGEKEAVCSTLTLKPSIANTIFDLVKIIEDSQCSAALSRNAMELIKSYI